MKPIASFSSLTIVFLAAILLWGCAGNTVKDAKMKDPRAQSSAPEAGAKDSVSIEAKLAAAQDDTTDVTEVIFEKGGTRLTQSYQDKIKKALIAAEEKAPIRHITVVAWSDQEMPRHEQKLTSEAVDLAKTRDETIVQEIHASRPKVDVEIVNMAERPGKLKRFLKTNDVRIQNALITAGTGETKAGHGIVIIETQQKK